MIQADDFINHALRYGFSFYSGVPCSYLKPLINYVISHKELTYVASVNEGDSVALCSGAAIAGRRAVVMLQNSGLGNAVNPLTSLNYIFRIPVLMIVSLRGDSQFSDEPQHELMGKITAKMLELMKIPWEFFPTQVDNVEPILYKAISYMETERRPFALILRKKDLAPFDSRVGGDNMQRGISAIQVVDERSAVTVLPSRFSMIESLVEQTSVDNTVIIATTGYTGRELYSVQDRDNHLYLVGSMGCAISVGLGLAMHCQNRKVFVLDGDGALLMRMGAMAGVGHYGTGNLVHIVFNNGVYLSTGGQKTLSDTVNFCKIASACGYKQIIAVNTIESFKKTLAQNFLCDTFILAEVSPLVSDNLPRPKVTPFEVVQRLERHILKNQTG